MGKTTLTIEGMHCEMCVRRVERALMKLKGVENITTDLKNKTTTIGGWPNSAEMKEALEDLGFIVTNIREQA